MKCAVEVAVEDLILAQIGHHSEADLVLPNRKLNGDTGDLDLTHRFFLGRSLARRGNCREQWGTNPLLFQPIRNLPGLPGRFQMVRLEGVDSSKDFQSFAGPECFRVWE